MKLITALIMICAATTAYANPFPEGDAQAGQQLFEKHKCNRCHVEMLGGDGSAIFTRPNRKVHTAAELLEQIRHLQRQRRRNLHAAGETESWRLISTAFTTLSEAYHGYCKRFDRQTMQTLRRRHAAPHRCQGRQSD